MAALLDPPFIPYHPLQFDPAEQLARGQAFYELLLRRRSIRTFSDAPVDRRLIELAIRAASSGPTGANKQPYRFAVVSDPAVKQQIRAAAEAEEKENYGGRFPQEWLEDLQPFGTDWEKAFLTVAPYLIVVFAISYAVDAEGNQQKHYYVNESVGIAAGLLITALHTMGLCTLTHTPSPMNFLQEVLGRPKNEKPVLLLPVGYAAQPTEVPNIRKKTLDELVLWYE